jgi:hemolysin D
MTTWRTARDIARNKLEALSGELQQKLKDALLATRDFVRAGQDSLPMERPKNLKEAWRAAQGFVRAGLEAQQEAQRRPKDATAGGAQLPTSTCRALVPVAPPRRIASDREFLPAALEILDTPPSPVKVALLWFICMVFTTALAWSYFGWIDIHAIAQGKIQPSGRSKVVQPLEPGKVAAIKVENGSRVAAGAVVMELDPTETTADREALARDLQASEAEIVRRKTVIAACRKDKPWPVIPFAPDTDKTVRERETVVLNAELSHLASTRQSLKAQVAEKAALAARFNTSVTAHERLIAVLKERVDMRNSLRAKQFGSRAAVIDALQELERETTSLVAEKGQALEAEAAMRSLESKLEMETDAFVATETQKLAETERKRDRTVQELVKARSKSERTRLRAPIAGTVQQLAVSSIGQVVSSGQPLMTIVPINGSIEIEAMILNQDIGFVEPGQEASVKVEAFPFTRYGAVQASVIKVSRDAVDEKAAEGLSDAASSVKPQSAQAAGSSSRMQSLVFPAILQLKQSSINVDGKTVPLSPGMAVTVEIKTGARRALDYVLAPLREVTAKAGHER